MTSKGSLGGLTLPKQKQTKQKKSKAPTKPAKQAKQASKQPKPARAKSSKQPKPARLTKQIKREKKQAKQAKEARARLQRSSARGKKHDRSGRKDRVAQHEVTQLPLAAPNMRIGLLGGTFNPPHAAHRDISLTALKRLGLDQVWWLVTPGNPLKDVSKLPKLAERVAAAREVASHPRIEVSGFDSGDHTSYTIDLLTKLKRRFPGVNFVWLMGADNLPEFHRWRAWEEIFAAVPIAVLDRPGFRLKACASKAAQRFSEYQVDESDARGLARLVPPAWTILTHKLSTLSSTELRARKAKRKKAKGSDKRRKKKAKRH
jgi:nicotinate-nucleotide adenylyltransferase